jgi:hypothetical protein
MRDAVRIVLAFPGSDSPAFVVELAEVASFYDRLQRGVEVRISDRPEHGSFGWWLPPGVVYHSLEVRGVGESAGFFLGLAREVRFREATGADLNWPG